MGDRCGILNQFVEAGIDARYNLGLSNIIKESDIGTAKNSVIRVGIFYLFGEKTGDR
ncbi:MAG TPA: hypothetical protein VFC34_00010 [Puia sp.]|nr:hypothetical protein [Puia sp.]